MATDQTRPWIAFYRIAPLTWTLKLGSCLLWVGFLYRNDGSGYLISGSISVELGWISPSFERLAASWKKLKRRWNSAFTSYLASSLPKSKR